MKSWVAAIKNSDDLNLNQLNAMQRACERLWRKAIREGASSGAMSIALYNRKLFSAELYDFLIRIGPPPFAPTEEGTRGPRSFRHRAP
jgi:hypothetical protein